MINQIGSCVVLKNDIPDNNSNNPKKTDATATIHNRTTTAMIKNKMPNIMYLFDLSHHYNGS